MSVLVELSLDNAGKYLSQLVAIENEAFAQPWSRDAYLTELARPISHVIAVVEGDRLLGYAGFWQVLDEAEIESLIRTTQMGDEEKTRLLKKYLVESSSE